MSTITVIVKMLSGENFVFTLSEGSTIETLTHAFEQLPGMNLPPKEFYLLRFYDQEQPLQKEDLLQHETLYTVFVDLIEWRVILPHWQTTGKHRSWRFAYMDLATGQHHILPRNDKGLCVLERANHIHYVFDTMKICDLIDLVNPWDYRLDDEGILAFLCEYIDLYQEDPIDVILNHPSLEEKYHAWLEPQ